MGKSYSNEANGKANSKFFPYVKINGYFNYDTTPPTPPVPPTPEEKCSYLKHFLVDRDAIDLIIHVESPPVPPPPIREESHLVHFIVDTSAIDFIVNINNN